MGLGATYKKYFTSWIDLYQNQRFPGLGWQLWGYIIDIAHSPALTRGYNGFDYSSIRPLNRNLRFFDPLEVGAEK